MGVDLKGCFIDEANPAVANASEAFQADFKAASNRMNGGTFVTKATLTLQA